jgi:DNA-directed RNA polymerase specialized sigma24 family protein
MNLKSKVPGPATRADRFLRSELGRAAVHRILAAQQLPQTLADDLRQEALRRVLVATSERGTIIDNVEGFVTSALHRAAVDIVRGRVRSPQIVGGWGAVDLDTDGRGRPRAAFASPVDVEADALAFESDAAVRRAIHNLLGVDPTAGAAALAYLAIAVDGAPAAPDCPQPQGGASFHEASEWAGLWYAGCDDCFPTHGAFTISQSTLRKRRSRAVERLRHVLLRSAAAAGLGSEAREPVGGRRG